MSHTIIFLHILKTAGTTLQAIISRQYAPSVLFFFGADAFASLDQFINLPTVEKKTLKVVAGHFSYGIHEYIPNSYSYFTFLRNPVELIISLYYFIRRIPEHYSHQLVLEQNISLHDFVLSNQTLTLDNIQTRFISGTWPEIPIGEITQEIFDRAVLNLYSFDVVGITEEFDRSLEILKATYFWCIDNYSALNITPDRPRQNEIDPEIIKAIQMRNHWDMKLYEIAKEINKKQYQKVLILKYVKKIACSIFRVLNRIPIIRRLLLAGNVKEQMGMLFRRML